MRRHRHSNLLLVRMHSGKTTLEDNLVLSQKVKNSLTVQSSNHDLKYLPNWSENLCPKSCTQMLITALFIVAKNGRKKDNL